jgi:hypothetical protein
VGEAEGGVEVEEGAVVVVDCYGGAGEEGGGGFAQPELADEQAVGVAFVLAGLWLGVGLLVGWLVGNDKGGRGLGSLERRV